MPGLPTHSVQELNVSTVLNLCYTDSLISGYGHISFVENPLVWQIFSTSNISNTHEAEKEISKYMEMTDK